MPGESNEVPISSTSKLAGPIQLPSHQLPERFYLGGPRISSFRGEASTSQREPEDWVASTTCCAGHDSLGLTRLPQTGTLLVDEIQRDPVAWLGPAHVSKYGSDTKLLIKLLDAGQRLPIHAHPHVDWARVHVNRNHGKAEAWHILTPGQVYLGLKAGVSAEAMLKMVDAQEIELMLSMMHCVQVEAGDTVYVPPGMLHAIGEGILLVEVQEPEDLSILLEWRDFQLDGRKDGHLGLGFEKALTAVDIDTLTADQLSTLVTRAKARTDSNLLAQQALEYFRMDRFHQDTTLDASFQVVVVLEGNVEVQCGDASTTATTLKAGSTTLVRHADGAVQFKLQGDSSFAVVRPPL
ncbi:related to Mannose-6-phosphate isomerase [Sporisorium reilianum SRZ2]|uniref:Related to Mannose-6-phosphate isomerase n=1 Tax=Sporisorium reilianum (strain SRZ2) TaxID=999809 RepID=E6ZWN2_SPORE|nr:related to Mannose-6-phosphate isomerase [Sporisorium reilianum SRZ2]